MLARLSLLCYNLLLSYNRHVYGTHTCLSLCLFNVESGIFICFQLLAALLTVLTALCTLSWWIADVVIFAQNDRLSGNGCVLTSI